MNFAPLCDYASEQIARQQDAVTFPTMPDLAAIEHTLRERLIATRASQEVLPIEKDYAFANWLRKVQRLAVIAAKVGTIGQGLQGGAAVGAIHSNVSEGLAQL